MTSAATMLSAALDLAERGWAILPIHDTASGACSCNKPDCKSRGKHPRIATGKKHAAASVDPDEIMSWWTQWPDANLATPTGARTGTVVIDIDPRHGGHDSLAALEELNEPLPRSVEVSTGGGGRHIFYEHPGIPITIAAIAEGVDIRADGKIVILPPSIHASGRAYRWVRHCETCEMRPLPDWLLNLLTRSREAA